jgi:hypothetical protein
MRGVGRFHVGRSSGGQRWHPLSTAALGNVDPRDGLWNFCMWELFPSTIINLGKVLHKESSYCP